MTRRGLCASCDGSTACSQSERRGDAPRGRHRPALPGAQDPGAGHHLHHRGHLRRMRAVSGDGPTRAPPRTCSLPLLRSFNIFGKHLPQEARHWAADLPKPGGRRSHGCCSTNSTSCGRQDSIMEALSCPLVVDVQSAFISSATASIPSVVRAFCESTPFEHRIFTRFNTYERASVAATLACGTIWPDLTMSWSTHSAKKSRSHGDECLTAFARETTAISRVPALSVARPTPNSRNSPTLRRAGSARAESKTTQL